jgi:hypothetical protein
MKFKKFCFKSSTVIIITFSLLISIFGCKKSDILEDDPIPSLAYFDISGAKFLLCNKHSENEYDFSKLSAGGVETDVAIVDQNNVQIDYKDMSSPVFIFSFDEYIGLTINWNKTKTIGNASYANTVFFYLIRKSDGKVLVSYDITQSDDIAHGLNFNIDQNDNIYYKSINGSLERLKWNKNDPSDVRIEVIDPDIDKYILAPNGDFAFSKMVNSFPKYYFRFSDGSKMEIPSPWSNMGMSFYESSGIIQLGISNYGKFCAYYKNANTDICQMKVLTELSGQTDFVYCNSVVVEIDEFCCVGNQLWGIHLRSNNNVDFINLSECGRFTIYPSYFLCHDFLNLHHSHHFFYSFDRETKKVYRLAPGNGIPSVWLSFPDGLDVYGSIFDFSKDEYSIFQVYYNSQDPQVNLKYFFLDNNGNIITQREGQNIYSWVVL